MRMIVILLIHHPMTKEDNKSNLGNRVGHFLASRLRPVNLF